MHRAPVHAHRLMISVLGALLACGLVSSLSAARALAKGGAGPFITHVGALNGGHEGPAEGPTTGGAEVVITGSNLLASAEGCLFAEALRPSSVGASLPACGDVIVRFGAAPALVTFASRHSLDVYAPAHQPAVVEITVTTPAGTSSAHAGGRFKYVGPPPKLGSGPPPQVTAVSPAAGPQSGFMSMEIAGDHLLPAGTAACVECAFVSVRFGESTVPVIEGTQNDLLVASPPHEPGTVDVAVSAAGRSSTASAADHFTYTGARRRHHGHRHHPHHHHPHRGMRH